jgi:sec-independent protein translocase protein TatA
VILAEILGPDLLIIIAIVALLFGGSQLPKLARSLGSAKGEFEKGIREGGNGEPDPPPPDDNVTMTRAELDRLIADREARGRGEAPSPS